MFSIHNSKHPSIPIPTHITLPPSLTSSDTSGISVYTAYTNSQTTSKSPHYHPSSQTHSPTPPQISAISSGIPPSCSRWRSSWRARCRCGRWSRRGSGLWGAGGSSKVRGILAICRPWSRNGGSLAGGSRGGSRWSILGVVWGSRTSTWGIWRISIRSTLSRTPPWAA